MAESKRAVDVGMSADLGIAAARSVAAGFTGSASLLTEGFHRSSTAASSP